MDSLFAITALKTLDSLSLRSAVTAENIANAGTDGYRPRKVQFEDALIAAAHKGSAEVEQFTPQIEASTAASDGLGPRLDLELAAASGTAGRYSAVVDILNRMLQIRDLALTGGK